MNETPKVTITHFSDVLCVWAYIAQVRADEISRRFGARVVWKHRFIPVFGDTEGRIGRGWAGRGGFEGYGRHVREAAGQFDHVTVHPEVWITARPASSASAHLFLKAVQLWEGAGPAPPQAPEKTAGAGSAPASAAAPGETTPETAPGESAPETPSQAAAWRLRLAFFRDCEDIADTRVQMTIAEDLGLPRAPLEEGIATGAAFAALCRDAEAVHTLKVEGSPTFVLNEGRQRLYGNVGYRVIEANVQELLSAPDLSRASWC